MNSSSFEFTLACSSSSSSSLRPPGTPLALVPFCHPTSTLSYFVFALVLFWVHLCAHLSWQKLTLVNFFFTFTGGFVKPLPLLKSPLLYFCTLYFFNFFVFLFLVFFSSETHLKGFKLCMFWSQLVVLSNLALGRVAFCCELEVPQCAITCTSAQCALKEVQMYQYIFHICCICSTFL